MADGRAQGAQAWAATRPLQAARVHLFQNRPGTGVRKIHHKLMVIDQRLTITGSFNYTGPANTLNHGEVESFTDLVGDLRELRTAATARTARAAVRAVEDTSDSLSNCAG